MDPRDNPVPGTSSVQNLREQRPDFSRRSLRLVVVPGRFALRHIEATLILEVRLHVAVTQRGKE